MDTTAKITKEMTIEDIFSQFPSQAQKLAQLMGKFGLECVGCSSATYETLEGGMMSHGLDQTKVEELVNLLNAALEQPVNFSTISLTPKAAAKIRQIAKDDGKEGWALRFGDKAAGCSGYEYFLDFSKEKGADDEIFHSEGVEVHVRKSSVSRLMGCQVDYSDGLQGSGFKITNPNVRSSCNCGTSHGY